MISIMKTYYAKACQLQSLLTSGIVRAARLQFLRSGHSHEDIDQVFGRLAAHIARRARRATGPHEFRDIIQNWLSNDLCRPYEPKRIAVVLDQVRDWHLASQCSCFSFAPDSIPLVDLLVLQLSRGFLKLPRL